jgi:hypothetical protein
VSNPAKGGHGITITIEKRVVIKWFYKIRIKGITIK